MIKTSEQRRCGIFIVNFEHNLRLFLVFLLWTLNKLGSYIMKNKFANNFFFLLENERKQRTARTMLKYSDTPYHAK